MNMRCTMKLTRLDRARGRRRGPLQPAPLPNQTVGCANYPPSVPSHHGRLRQASLPVSPETAVPGGFAYAPLLRSASSRAPNTLLISLFSLSLIRLSQTGETGCPVAVEARLTGTFVVADPPDNAGAARVSAQRTDGVKRGRGWRGRAFGPSNCRSLR